MDLSTFEALGWRDVVIAAVALVGVYMLVAIVRYFGLRKHRAAVPPPTSPAEPALAPPAPPVAAAVEPAPRAAWPHTEADFAQHLRSSTAESEMKQLRGELARMRDELSGLGDELVHLRQELEALKGARNVSPLYGDAIALAQQGLDARGIAERCNISIGEAELVAALTRKQQPNQDSEDDDERK